MQLRSPWVRRALVAAIAIVGVAWLPNQIFGSSGLQRLYHLRSELADLRQGNAELRQGNARLKAELTLDGDDDLAAIERNARDELGFVRPGEVVYRLDDGAGSGTGGASAPPVLDLPAPRGASPVPLVAGQALPDLQDDEPAPPSGARAARVGGPNRQHNAHHPSQAQRKRPHR